ncbi:MAG: DUF2887 domain-containing protein, partial [Nitrospirales bacterium]|nr:DUF2887 domain-containing protein [Nitrospirales bacterium]
MLSDALLYELFSIDPLLLFHLLGILPPDEYDYQSITIKGIERRLDGILRPKHGKGPWYLV